jgi:hypothetical protein
VILSIRVLDCLSDPLIKVASMCISSCPFPLYSALFYITARHLQSTVLNRVIMPDEQTTNASAATTTPNTADPSNASAGTQTERTPAERIQALSNAGVIVGLEGVSEWELAVKRRGSYSGHPSLAEMYTDKDFKAQGKHGHLARTWLCGSLTKSKKPTWQLGAIERAETYDKETKVRKERQEKIDAQWGT